MSPSATPPWYFSARTVATTTATSGRSPDLRHLMSTNFSAPRSAPNPASVTTMSAIRRPERGAIEGLHQVRREGVPQQRRHRAVRTEVPRGDRLHPARLADHDVTDPSLQ